MDIIDKLGWFMMAIQIIGLMVEHFVDHVLGWGIMLSVIPIFFVISNLVYTQTRQEDEK